MFVASITLLTIAVFLSISTGQLELYPLYSEIVSFDSAFSSLLGLLKLSSTGIFISRGTFLFWILLVKWNSDAGELIMVFGFDGDWYGLFGWLPAWSSNLTVTSCCSSICCWGNTQPSNSWKSSLAIETLDDFDIFWFELVFRQFSRFESSPELILTEFSSSLWLKDSISYGEIEGWIPDFSFSLIPDFS